MLRSLDSILGSSIVATDGEIGKAYNVLFDDRSWAVRYLVVETGSWFTRRRVLVSPGVLGIPDWVRNTIPVLLTKQQVQESPDVNADQPVSRRHELALIRHYGWPDHLGLESVPASGQSEASPDTDGDPHLRSAKEVTGYRADANDGALGTVTDFMVDDERWGILNLVVETESPQQDRKVLVLTQWVSAVSWKDRHVQLSQQRAKAITGDFLTDA